MRFEFATSTRIVFGAGTLNEVAPAAKQLGRRPLLITGKSIDRAAPLARELDAPTFPIDAEPTVQNVRDAVAFARAERCDMVISLGGGSAIDAGKAVASLLANGGDPLDYLEVIGRGQPIERPSAPYIAIPTTAGTGSEVTRNAVLGSPEHGVKASLRSPLMLPRLAVIDPELTYDLPPEITASTGLDALAQLIEPYVSIRANPMTDVFCLDGMRRVSRSLRAAFSNPQYKHAREDMCIASLFGGLCLANAGLGAVHGFAAPVGGMFPAPHGAVCAVLLPHVVEVNVEALTAREPDSPVRERYRTIAQTLTGRPEAEPADAVACLHQLCEDLRIPQLSAWGVTPDHVGTLVGKAAQASSMKANPIVLNTEELTRILTAAI